MRIQSYFYFLALVNGLFVGSNYDRGVSLSPVRIDNTLFSQLIIYVSVHAFIAELLTIEPSEASAAIVLAGVTCEHHEVRWDRQLHITVVLELFLRHLNVSQKVPVVAVVCFPVHAVETLREAESEVGALD